MKRGDKNDLDLTPMIDVTFLILIFFMVTASFSMRRAFEIPQPMTDAASPVAIDPRPEEAIRLVVDERGGFFLMAPEYQREIIGKQSLIAELSNARLETAESGLKIEVETDAKLQSLVDAIDAATLAGFARYELSEIDSPWI